MNRPLRFWLALTVCLLVAANLLWGWWQNRGLITVHAENQPFSKILESVSRQAGVHLASNLEPSTPVTVHFDKLRLSGALEHVAAAVDGRWGLTYLYAPDKATIQSALSTFSSGRLPENWKTYRLPLPDFLEEEGPPPDPRTLVCEPTPPSESNLRGYLMAFVQFTDAVAAAPEEWNPTVNRPLAKDTTPKVAEAIAKSSKSVFQETFFITVRPSDGPREDERGPRGDRGERARLDPAVIAKRMEQKIAQLPPEKQEAAKAEFQQQQAFWQELRSLPEEERRAKIMQRLEDPVVQERMEKREAYRDSLRTPQKRLERYNRYLERKQRAQAQANS